MFDSTRFKKDLKACIKLGTVAIKALRGCGCEGEGMEHFCTTPGVIHADQVIYLTYLAPEQPSRAEL